MSTISDFAPAATEATQEIGALEGMRQRFDVSRTMAADWLHDRFESRSARSLVMLTAAGSLLVSACGTDTKPNGAGDGSSSSGAPTGVEVCDNATYEFSTNQADKFDPEAFLPKTDKLANTDDAKNYITALFDQDGPLGTKISPDALAAIVTTIVKPSHDKVATDANFDYVQTFKNTFGQYKADGGLDVAQQDCAAAKDTMEQSAQFNGTWALNGETVTEFMAVRDDKFNVIAMTMHEMVTNSTLSGIEFLLRDSNKGLDGFTSVLLTANGNLYIKGVTIGNGQSVNLNEVPAQSSDSSDSSSSENGGGGDNGTNQGNGGTGGAAGPNGNNPEAGPGGVTQSPGQGSESSSSSSSTGSTGTTGTTGTTITIPRSSTTNTTGTTGTTIPRSSSSTTPTTKGNPDGCDPNLGEICDPSTSQVYYNRAELRATHGGKDALPLVLGAFGVGIVGLAESKKRAIRRIEHNGRVTKASK